jgi:aspartate-semialdehyde dehydrogenase
MGLVPLPKGAGFFLFLSLANMKVAVVGATGLVGTKMLKVLGERNFPVSEMIPVASEKSAGKMVEFRGKLVPVTGIEQALEKQPDFALFSAGGGVSTEWGPRFAARKTYVIDNSSAWRMHQDVPLVVPEVNGSILSKEHYLVANPNCSTIQLVMALWPIHRKNRLKRVIVSTYQSVTGTGAKAIQQLESERAGHPISDGPYPYPIDLNLIPHIDVFQENGFTKEEMKIIQETKKIMGVPLLDIAATAVRVPVMGGHSESVFAEFCDDIEPAEARQLLADFEGVVVIDNPAEKKYPMPLFCEEKNEVFVGRIRQDLSHKNALHFWVVSDNLRKGAATNAVQIAERLLKHF